MRKCSRCLIEKPLVDFYVSGTYTCKQCIRDRATQWYSNNTKKAKDRISAYQKSSPEKRAKWQKTYLEKHKERILKASRAYSEKYPERRVASRSKWNNANRERIAKVSSKWQKNNREKCAAYWAAYHAAKLRAVPKWANKFFISEAYDLARRRTKATGFPWHVDHQIPLISPFVCGLHVENNIQVIPGSINMSKGNKFDRDWKMA